MAKCLCAHKNMCIRYINTQKPNIQSKNEVYMEIYLEKIHIRNMPSFSSKGVKTNTKSFDINRYPFKIRYMNV